ncbi:hypothetical protein FOA52_009806 [Chlamydomonas sp. UWO 241]|nr:hypothetical protein FOA52_009806 [Chlamydomonas sp. UWO 241]
MAMEGRACPGKGALAGARDDLKRAKEAGANYNPAGAAGSAWSHNFLNQKPWHPSNFRNRMVVWETEQKSMAEAKDKERGLAEFEAEQQLLQTMSYLSEEQQQRYKDRQSISFMYQKPPGYDAMLERDKAADEKKQREAAAAAAALEAGAQAEGAGQPGGALVPAAGGAGAVLAAVAQPQAQRAAAVVPDVGEKVRLDPYRTILQARAALQTNERFTVRVESVHGGFSTSNENQTLLEDDEQPPFGVFGGGAVGPSDPQNLPPEEEALLAGLSEADRARVLKKLAKMQARDQREHCVREAEALLRAAGYDNPSALGSAAEGGAESSSSGSGSSGSDSGSGDDHVTTHDASTRSPGREEPATSSHTMPPLARRDVRNLVRKLGADARPAQLRQALDTIAGLSDCGGDRGSLVAIAAAGAIPPLVQLLRAGCSVVQLHAATSLANLALIADSQVAIADAGAVPPLVKLLGPASSAEVQEAAAAALGNLAQQHAGNFDTIAAAGDVPLLVQLLGPGSSAKVQATAAVTLGNLALNAENVVTIAAAGAIPPLVLMLGPSCPALVQQHAAGALMRLATHADNQVTIAASGGIPPLVQLMGPGSSPLVQEHVALALARLSQNAANQAIIVAAGAIPPLVQLLGPGSSALVQQYAATALGRLALAADNQATIASAGAIPPLVQLTGPGSTTLVQQSAALALAALAANNADNRRAIAAAGASAELLQEIEAL